MNSKSSEGQIFAGKKVLITGGLGFIGSTLAHRLVDFGARVSIMDSLIPEHGGNLFNVRAIADRVQVSKSDVRDERSIHDLIQGQDYLFNLAGQTSHMDSMTDPETDLEINCRAQLSILESCRKYNPGVKVIFASTRQIYGRPDYLPVDERHPLRPVDVNGINKMAGEWYHILYHNVYGIRACVLRLTNTVGPRMRVKDARQTFVGIWIRKLIEGQPFEVWGGEQRRDFSYVDDAVDAFLVAACADRANGQVFNVGGGEVIDLRALAELLVELNGSGQFVVREFPLDRKRIDIGDFYADARLLHSALGWSPQTSLRDGLARTLDYYRQNLSHYV